MTSTPPYWGRRKEAMARTREALIDAGLRLAERTGLTGLSVNLIVQDAGVAQVVLHHSATAPRICLHCTVNSMIVSWPPRCRLPSSACRRGAGV